VLVELGLVEQRLAAVKEVLDDGATVTDVARRYGVVRQTVHEWLRRYARHGLAGWSMRRRGRRRVRNRCHRRGGADRRAAPCASRLGATHDRS